MSFIYGFLVIMLCYLATGLKKHEIFWRAPILSAEIASFVEGAVALLDTDAFANSAAKHKGHWVSFFQYFGCQVVFGIASYWGQMYLFELLYEKASEEQRAVGIMHHQALVFLLSTTLNAWTDGHWSSMTGVARTFFLIVLSWAAWRVSGALDIEFSSLSEPGLLNSFHVTDSFYYSVVFANLLWSNVLGVLPQRRYAKVYGSVQARMTFMAPTIVLVAALHWLALYWLERAISASVRPVMRDAAGVWKLLCFGWYGFTIVGAHVSAPLWSALDRTVKKQGRLVFIYAVAAWSLGVLCGAVVYYVYQLILYPIVFTKLLKLQGFELLEELDIPGQLLVLGAAAVPHAYQKVKNWWIQKTTPADKLLSDLIDGNAVVSYL